MTSKLCLPPRPQSLHPKFMSSSCWHSIRSYLNPKRIQAQVSSASGADGVSSKELYFLALHSTDEWKLPGPGVVVPPSGNANVDAMLAAEAAEAAEGGAGEGAAARRVGSDAAPAQPDFSNDPRVVRAAVDGGGTSAHHLPDIGIGQGGGVEGTRDGAASYAAGGLDTLPVIGERNGGGGLSETAVVRAARAEEEGMQQGKGQRTMMRERALAAVEARIGLGASTPGESDDGEDEDDVEEGGDGSSGSGGDDGYDEGDRSTDETTVVAVGSVSAAALTDAAIDSSGGESAPEVQPSDAVAATAAVTAEADDSKGGEEAGSAREENAS